jgi:polyhydroxyalkanoate synthesis regulator phasin
MKKLIATISIIAALGIGAVALNSVMPAGALGGSAAQAADPSSSCASPRAKGKDVLDTLVANGTITQTQEDAIIQAMKDARQAPGGTKAGAGPRMNVIAGMLKVSADKIGVQVSDLTSALKNGQSIADVANAHTVSPSVVVSAIVDAGNTKLADAVTNGKLTQPQADALKAKLPQLADNFVNHTRKSC